MSDPTQPPIDTHSEALAEADRIYKAGVAEHEAFAVACRAVQAERDALKLQLSSAKAEIASLGADIDNLEAEVLRLEARIAELEGQVTTPPTTQPPTTQPTTPPPTTQPTTQPPTTQPTTPPPAGAAWWNDEFLTAPDDTRYVRACADPAANFVLSSPGNLDCIFVTGKTGGPHASAASNKVLRSELLIRIPGTNLHKRQDVGKDYVNEFALTVPTTFAPAVPNEKVLLHQWWQEQSVKPPVQFQMLDPSSASEPLMFRLVLSAPAVGTTIPAKNELIVWKLPVVNGKRYDISLRTKWAFGTAGLFVLKIDGIQVFEQANLPTCYNFAQGMVPHMGQYFPGSADDAVGVKTTIRFHRWNVRQI